MALIDPDYEEEVLHQVTREYLSAFPKMEGKYSAYICESADGVVMK
ncbi:gHMP kinase family protein [Ruminococcus sp. CAG:60]|nr:gHMP kinase family protein [Ruminococcus sp. CAG:60]